MSTRTVRATAAPHFVGDAFEHPAAIPTERDLLEAYLERGIRDVVSVPCSITDTWHALAADEARRGRMNLIMTSHEGNLAGIAGGIWFGTGRPALVHMQNSGLPNAGDGLISFADPEVFGVPMAAMVTFRGATAADDSEPHQAIGRRTDALAAAIFGSDAEVRGHRSGRALLDETRRSIDAALEGRVGVVKVADAGFRKSHRATLPPERPAATADARTLRRTKGVGSLDAALCVGRRPSREDAIRAICARHPRAAILFCNGYTARAARAICDSPRSFYNIGYMGGTLAIGWGLAKSRPDVEVVVVDGDQNALMSAMKDQLAADYPPNLHWYVLDNGIGASVGTSESLPLPECCSDLARVIRTRPDEPGSFAHPRVRALVPGQPVSTLAARFRAWLASPASSIACRLEAAEGALR
ncbi:MAG: thiamine pyrophosphate-dependent enzyme [Planctomycetota bacterium]